MLSARTVLNMKGLGKFIMYEFLRGGTRKEKMYGGLCVTISLVNGREKP